MKKLVVLVLVLGLAAMANAGLTLSVSSTLLAPSDTASVSIYGDYTVLAQGLGDYFLGTVVGGGPGSLSNMVLDYTGNDSSVYTIDDSELAEFLGIENPLVGISLSDLTLNPPLVNGLLVHGIFHCGGAGNVTLVLLDGDGYLVDSVVISQIPEPMTLALLGLGGLFIRRK